MIPNGHACYVIHIVHLVLVHNPPIDTYVKKECYKKWKHYMKIDHTLCFLQYFISQIYHCNEYAYLPNP